MIVSYKIAVECRSTCYIAIVHFKMWSSVAFFVTIVAVANCQYAVEEICNTPSDINVEWTKLFNQTWYEVYRHRYNLDVDVHCANITSMPSEDSSSNYTLHIHSVKNKLFLHDHADVTIIGSGNFDVSNTSFRVLLADADSYAVIHACDTNNTWILSRHVYLKTKAIQPISSFMSDKMKWEDFENVQQWGTACSKGTSMKSMIFGTVIIFVTVFKLPSILYNNL